MSKRKTLLANEIPQFDEDQADVVDDQAEKRRRVSEVFNNISPTARLQRKNRIAQENNELQRTTPVLNNRKSLAPGAGPVTPAQPKPSNEQLSILYNNCVKLLNENKINVKNAFQLKLIDYMSDIVLNKEISGGVTNFQVVGCTIDVGTKIYAARVDALHQNTYQMLSGLGHTNNEQAGEENGSENADGMANDEGNDDDEQNPRKAKNKKKKMKKSTYIVENLDTITTKLKDEFQDEDLYFSKVSTAIENEGIAGILTNKLRTMDDSILLMINKDDKQDQNMDTFANQPDCEASLKSVVEFCKSKNVTFKDVQLCSDLNSFRFIGWNLESEDKISEFVKSMIENEENLEAHRFDENNRHSNLNLSTESGLHGGEIDIDDYCHDIPGDNDAENVNLHDLEANRPNEHHSGLEMLDKIDDVRSLHSVADLTTLISNMPNDYSYFSFDKLKLHDMPRHLKRIAQQLALARPTDANNPQSASTNQPRTVTARNKREAPRVEFKEANDLTKYFKVTKKATCLVDRTIEKRSEKPCCLESERQLDYNAKEMFQPYFKSIAAKIFSDVDPIENLLVNDDLAAPKTNTQQTNEQLARGADDDDGHMGGLDDDFEIPFTAQTNEQFFTQNGGEYGQSQQTDLMKKMNGDDELGMHAEGDLDHRFDGENLIEAPLQVNALNIEYAKTSKNIDVRRLKQVIWALLCENADKENITDENLSMLNDTANRQGNKNVNSSLKLIYQRLKPPLITQKVYDDLSICIVFQMLLFLANEHGLLLKNDPIGSDVVITSY